MRSNNGEQISLRYSVASLEVMALIIADRFVLLICFQILSTTVLVVQPLLIAVEENETVLDDTPEKMGLVNVVQFLNYI